MEKFSTEFITKKPIIVSFPRVLKTEPDMNGREMYSAEFLIPKEDKESIDAIQTCIQNAIINQWGNKAPKGLGIPMYDGDGTKPRGSAWPEEYKGCMVIRSKANADHPPLVRDKFGNNLRNDPEAATKVFGGDKVYAVLRFYAYDGSGNKGVGCGLSQVMFTGKGTAFGGGATNPNALDMFVEQDDNPFAGFQTL